MGSQRWLLTFVVIFGVTTALPLYAGMRDEDYRRICANLQPGETAEWCEKYGYSPSTGAAEDDDHALAKKIGYWIGTALLAPITVPVYLLKAAVTPLGEGQPSLLQAGVAVAGAAAAMRPDPAPAPAVTQNTYIVAPERPAVQSGTGIQIPESHPQPQPFVAAPAPRPHGNFSVTTPDGRTNCRWKETASGTDVNCY